MKAYLALMFCKKEDITSYGREVAATIMKLSGGRMQRAAGSEGLVTIAFVTDAAENIISRSFEDLWRSEQRTWLLPLEGARMIDKNLMDWARKQIPNSPF